MLGPPLRTTGNRHVVFEGRRMLFFGGIDYHRMSRHPGVIRAASRAGRKHGLTGSGSRTTTGNHPLYIRLERRLADFFETEAAVVIGSGYLANLVLLQAIGESYSRYFVDEAAHSSLTDAASATATVETDRIHRFKHVDARDLARKVRAHCRAADRPLVLTDGVFPARGEIPPLAAYAKIVRPFEGRLIVDDAHAVAVVGDTGKGSPELCGIARTEYYQTGTLSKGFGVYGGFITGTSDLIDAVREKSAAFTGSTGLSLPMAAAAIRSIDYLAAHPRRITGLRIRALAVKEELRRAGFDLPDTPVPIISITHGDEERNNATRDLLKERGIFPPFIHYPGAPRGGHFRFALSSAHSDSDLRLLVDTIIASRECQFELRPQPAGKHPVRQPLPVWRSR